MDHPNYPDSYIRGILNTVKTIAMVGISPKENRPSYFAFKYLLERGYRMIPVNPGHAGETMLGQKIYARLGDIPGPIDIALVDGIHTYEFVMKEWEILKRRMSPGGVVLFDDITYDAEMRKAWKEVRSDPVVGDSVALWHRLGIVELLAR